MSSPAVFVRFTAYTCHYGRGIIRADRGWRLKVALVQPYRTGGRIGPEGRQGGNGDGDGNGDENEDWDGGGDEDGDRGKDEEEDGNGDGTITERRWEGRGRERFQESTKSNINSRGGAEDARNGVTPTDNQQPQPQCPTPQQEGRHMRRGGKRGAELGRGEVRRTS